MEPTEDTTRTQGGLGLDLALLGIAISMRAVFGIFSRDHIPAFGVLVPIYALVLAALALPTLTRLLRLPWRASTGRLVGGVACISLTALWAVAASNVSHGHDISLVACGLAGAGLVAAGAADRWRGAAARAGASISPR